MDPFWYDPQIGQRSNVGGVVAGSWVTVVWDLNPLPVHVYTFYAFRVNARELSPRL
jgi:hypothetical protein